MDLWMFDAEWEQNNDVCSPDRKGWMKFFFTVITGKACDTVFSFNNCAVCFEKLFLVKGLQLGM